MKEKIIIVTGGNKGIGKAISLKFAELGAKVKVFARTIPDDLNGFVAEKSELLTNIEFFAVDVSDFDSVAESVNKIVKSEGKIDVLVNNAGVTKYNLLMRMSPEDWDFVMDINLKGAFNCSKAVIRTMMGQRYGRIINIGSIVGTIGNPGQINYSASKAGLVGLTKSMAKELASRNILVNLIAPGYVETNMTDALNEEQKAKLVDNIPLRRVANPSEIADVVVFFAHDDSKYITGQVLHVDGGLAI
jgi:3-oxoacyl-[acyl-carrier protein] reductase